MDPKHLYQLAGRCSQSSLSAYAAVIQLGTRDDHFKIAARGSLMLATLSVWERVWCVYGLARASACVCGGRPQPLKKPKYQSRFGVSWFQWRGSLGARILTARWLTGTPREGLRRQVRGAGASGPREPR
jgi:hypothetical protein